MLPEEAWIKSKSATKDVFILLFRFANCPPWNLQLMASNSPTEKKFFWKPLRSKHIFYVFPGLGINLNWHTLEKEVLWCLYWSHRLSLLWNTIPRRASYFFCLQNTTAMEIHNVQVEMYFIETSFHSGGKKKKRMCLYKQPEITLYSLW